MPRNNQIDNNDLDLINEDDVETKKGGKFSTILIGVAFLVVWLGIFCVLIKLDVGGFGSSVMRPIFKDVPIISAILPDDPNEGTDGYPYKSLADAITYIKELEKELQTADDTITSDNETIAELKSEVERLSNFETDRDAFEKVKEQFYDEVVFGDDALPYDNYKFYYESINPDYAETLYKQVLEKYMYDENYKELANAYSSMKPKKAAASIYEMTGDLDTVVSILENMDTDKRAAILDALSDIDAVFCGKITVLLAP
jgi:flagellar motility protein MotE (MotC chaperone)